MVGLTPEEARAARKARKAEEAEIERRALALERFVTDDEVRAMVGPSLKALKPSGDTPWDGRMLIGVMRALEGGYVSGRQIDRLLAFVFGAGREHLPARRRGAGGAAEPEGGLMADASTTLRDVAGCAELVEYGEPCWCGAGHGDNCK